MKDPLSITHPALSKQWHPTKNGALLPSNVPYGSSNKFWFLCEKGHSFDAKLYNVTGTNKRWCPYCSNQKGGYGNSLLDKYPDIAKQWNYNLNEKGPDAYVATSNKKVWWTCEKGHDWDATIDKRVGNGSGCVYCANLKVGYGNSLADMRPDIAKHWFYGGNKGLTPKDVVVGSATRVWWKCDNGHIHKARVVAKTRKPKFGCKYCPGVGRNHKYEAPLDFN